MKKALHALLAISLTGCAGYVPQSEQGYISSYTIANAQKKERNLSSVERLDKLCPAGDVSYTSFGVGEMLVDKYHSTFKPKGEFETTAEYESRVSSGGDVFASLEVDIIPSYDADTEKLSFTTHLFESMDYALATDAFSKPGLELSLGAKVGGVLISKERYEGVNGFGAKSDILEVREKVYFASLEILNEKVGAVSQVVGSAHVPLEVAKSHLEDFSLLIKGVLVAPYIAHRKDYIPATISYPTEIFSNQYFIRLHPCEYQLVNTSNGTQYSASTRIKKM